MRSLLTILLLFVPLAEAQPPPSLNRMPMPEHVQLGTGQLVIDRSFSVAITGPHDPRLQRSVEIFLDDLRRQTGMLPRDMEPTGASTTTLVVHSDQPGKKVQEPGEDDSYTLEVSATGARLSAPTSLGALHGLQTFLQLVVTGPSGFAVPAVNIQDKPRFPWRGLMIDVSRHYMPLDVLKRNLDGMADVKLNVFHWHLSDDQGFRVESKKFPKLHRLGSDGQYYTQDQVRELIAYARDRGIRVVPEFDMPGHSTAWFVGYPELASAPGPYEIERKWGEFDPTMDPTQEHTYKFLDKFIGEMAQLFPDEYFHIGGDEVNGKQWARNPKIQEFMQSHGLKNKLDLQAYFTQRVQELVRKHGKTMVGWEPSLRPELPRSTVIQAWHGQAQLAEAAKQGYRGLLSYGYYLDLMWPASRHYQVDPMADAAAHLSPEEKQRILGGEACMWTEYVSPESIDSRIWPRTAAIAERLWSPQGVQDVNSMYQRLEEISRRLEWLGLTHNSSYVAMLRRIAGRDDISALRVLADVVEPVKDYTREELAPVPATSADPVNRLVDAVRPESQTARQFAEMVNALVAGSASAETKARLRRLLTEWRDNQIKLQPLAANSFLLQEALPLSQDLSALGDAGLRAMDYLDRGERAPEAWRTTQFNAVELARRPRAQLLLMVAPSVEKLIEATGAGTPALPGK
jgi:hexosaminidase